MSWGEKYDSCIEADWFISVHVCQTALRSLNGIVSVTIQRALVLLVINRIMMLCIILYRV